MSPLLSVSYLLVLYMPSLGYGTDHVMESGTTKELIDNLLHLLLYLLTAYLTSFSHFLPTQAPLSSPISFRYITSKLKEMVEGITF